MEVLNKLLGLLIVVAFALAAVYGTRGGNRPG